jgi:hypothetical protein
LGGVSGGEYEYRWKLLLKVQRARTGLIRNMSLYEGGANRCTGNIDKLFAKGEFG